VNRAGGEIGVLGPLANYKEFHVSPDDRTVAVTVNDEPKYSSDLFLVDVARGTSSRFVATTHVEFGPVWSPDGRRIVFSSDRDAAPYLHQKSLDSAGDGDALVPPDVSGMMALDWSPDGRSLLVGRFSPETNFDLWMFPIARDRKPMVFLNTPFDENDGRFSPNGRWVAYVSDESGRPEVYVRPFPGPGIAKPISSRGGKLPRWRRDGKELFFVEGDRLMAVPVQVGATFEAGTPVTLFQRTSGWIIDFDAAADGQSFIVNSGITGPGNLPIHVVVNWMARLKP
jgi:Tol biopolymer transport system component